MTRLVTLDLSCTKTFSQGLILTHPNLETLTRNLTSLRDLLLDGIYISDEGNKWSRTLSFSLPELQVLSLSFCSLSGPLDSSLLQLQSLSKLQLSHNNLSTEIPDFLGDFPNLIFLDLTDCGLYGEFPLKKILSLRTLQILYLGNNKRLQGSLPEFRKDGMLQELVLSGTSFTGELPYSIGNLKFLSILDLFDCGFNGSIPASISNLDQLQILQLAWNRFTGLIPPISCKNLVFLSLSQNGFTGPIPLISGSESLEYINLSDNRLAGPIHSEWNKLQKLGTLQLVNNSFNGTIPLTLFSLPTLMFLDLSINQFGGHLSKFSGVSSSLLQSLDLSNNRLQGPIPVSISNLSKLSNLNLRSNNFSGTMLFHNLGNLKKLDISDNRFSINTINANFALFPQMEHLKMSSFLDLSNNQIHGNIPNWFWKIGNGNLGELNLSNNFLEDPTRPFPIHSFPYFEILDLHSNMLQGKNPFLPSQGVAFIDYSFNNFTSLIPHISFDLSGTFFISFSNNQLNGEIPTSICEAMELQILYLSDNNFEWENTAMFRVPYKPRRSNLRGNNLSGPIPSVCGESLYEETWSLTTLNLNGNKLEGKLPTSISNCTKLEFLDVGNNNLNGVFPSWLGSISQLHVLCNFPMLQIIDISSNEFSGVLSRECLSGWKAMMAYETEAEWNRKDQTLGFEYIYGSKLNYQIEINNKGIEVNLVKILTTFTSIDFSNNRFEGEIPRAIGNFTPLYNLNFSRNSLTGSIPSTFGNLKHLESLDLSKPNISSVMAGGRIDPCEHVRTSKPLNFISQLINASPKTYLK
ncbi:hypothetical protein MKX01_042460 [Papaver californicum]|nr:hypothetical protein MKX01_042460 [Papaver californicum]